MTSSSGGHLSSSSSLTNMFDPHIYACQSLVSESINSNSAITDDAQKPQNIKAAVTPSGSPQKPSHKNVTSNTVILIQSTESETPKTNNRKKEIVFVQNTLAELPTSKVGTPDNTTNTQSTARNTT
ncbi:CLUMA_CG012681, isoform A [Clunio marinus]|uniref:CLUMA_CG012681, isoform A n=1 Tax=Clunio marinus TaxID=568069 RepID=A0A1J1ILY8_9DIPT|nr:CLUMA_CG012681, isoform A [Clunio marinus]